MAASTVSLMQPTPTTATASERVAANVRAELAARKIKWEAFGALLGWSPSTRRRLDGASRWDVDEVEFAAAHLGIDVTALTVERAA